MTISYDAWSSRNHFHFDNRERVSNWSCDNIFLLFRLLLLIDFSRHSHTHTRSTLTLTHTHTHSISKKDIFFFFLRIFLFFFSSYLFCFSTLLFCTFVVAFLHTWLIGASSIERKTSLFPSSHLTFHCFPHALFSITLSELFFCDTFFYLNRSI